jgi:hypothetical protein
LVTFLRLLAVTISGVTRVDWRGMAAEITERIGEEIDYRTEAANQQRFADAYRGHPFIRIPEVLPELSTRRVLTVDLVEGLRYAEALRADCALRTRWGEAINNGKSMLVEKFRRLHPPNLDDLDDTADPRHQSRRGADCAPCVRTARTSSR